MAKIYAAFLSYFSRCKHLSERGCRVWHFLCKLNLFDFPHFNQANSRSIFNSNPQLNAIFSLTYHLSRTKNETRMNINDMNIRFPNRNGNDRGICHCQIWIQNGCEKNERHLKQTLAGVGGEIMLFVFCDFGSIYLRSSFLEYTRNKWSGLQTHVSWTS